MHGRFPILGARARAAPTLYAYEPAAQKHAIS